LQLSQSAKILKNKEKSLYNKSSIFDTNRQNATNKLEQKPPSEPPEEVVEEKFKYEKYKSTGRKTRPTSGIAEHKVPFRPAGVASVR